MIDRLIDEILRREGGFVDNPADRGGPTKFGITQARLARHRGHDVSRQDVKDMIEVEARDIYTIDLAPLVKIPNDDVRAAVFDALVMSGQTNAVKMLQRALGVKADGIIGPVTLAAIPYLDGRKLAIRVVAENIRFLGRIITRNLTDADRDGIPDNTEFAAGWFNRKADQLERLA